MFPPPAGGAQSPHFPHLKIAFARIHCLVGDCIR
jgi:hypothetical protein